MAPLTLDQCRDTASRLAGWPQAERPVHCRHGKVWRPNFGEVECSLRGELVCRMWRDCCEVPGSKRSMCAWSDAGLRSQPIISQGLLGPCKP